MSELDKTVREYYRRESLRFTGVAFSINIISVASQAVLGESVAISVVVLFATAVCLLILFVFVILLTARSRWLYDKLHQ